MLKAFENLFWDFDGVIINSEEIRIKAFEYMLLDYRLEDVEKLIEYHNNNGGLSRYVKIDYFFSKILKEKLSINLKKNLLDRYNKYCLKNLCDKEILINESIDFIKKYYKSKNFYVASGSDNKELNYLCKKLNVYNYFISINGSPEKKQEIIKRIITINNYDKLNTCLIGDSINDYEAAISNGISFYGYNNPNLKNIKNLNYIENFLI